VTKHPIDLDRGMLLYRHIKDDLARDEQSRTDTWASDDLHELFDRLGFIYMHVLPGVAARYPEDKPQDAILVETCDDLAWHLVSKAIDVVERFMQRKGWPLYESI
jgi:hypothetical protein